MEKDSKFTEEQRENARKVVSALRSGTYLKGVGTLMEQTGRYCCWGDATKILIPDYTFIPDEEGYPPLRVAELLGREDGDPFMERTISMNDHGMPFTSIAIEFEREYGLAQS